LSSILGRTKIWGKASILWGCESRPPGFWDGSVAAVGVAEGRKILLYRIMLTFEKIESFVHNVA